MIDIIKHAIIIFWLIKKNIIEVIFLMNYRDI